MTELNTPSTRRTPSEAANFEKDFTRLYERLSEELALVETIFVGDNVGLAAAYDTLAALLVQTVTAAYEAKDCARALVEAKSSTVDAASQVQALAAFVASPAFSAMGEVSQKAVLDRLEKRARECVAQALPREKDLLRELDEFMCSSAFKAYSSADKEGLRGQRSRVANTLGNMLRAQADIRVIDERILNLCSLILTPYELAGLRQALTEQRAKDLRTWETCGAATIETESARQNCGGDCLPCMVKVGDSDAALNLARLQKDEIDRLNDTLTAIKRLVVYSTDPSAGILQQVAHLCAQAGV